MNQYWNKLCNKKQIPPVMRITREVLFLFERSAGVCGLAVNYGGGTLYQRYSSYYDPSKSNLQLVDILSDPYSSCITQGTEIIREKEFICWRNDSELMKEMGYTSCKDDLMAYSLWARL
jgi:hypothetical protein